MILDILRRDFEAFFHKADTDNDGFLTLQELTACLRKHGYRGTDDDIAVSSHITHSLRILMIVLLLLMMMMMMMMVKIMMMWMMMERGRGGAERGGAHFDDI